MRYLVDVQGRQVGVERVWSKRPRLFLDGEEMAGDRWGRRLLTLPDGTQQEVRVVLGAGVLSPRLQVGDGRYPIGRALPRWVVVALAVFVVLGFLGGALGVVLAMVGAVVAVRLLIDPRRGAGHVVAAVGVLVLTVVLYVVLAGLVAALI